MFIGLPADRGVQRSIWRLGPPGGLIADVAFDPTGRYLATANGDGSLGVLRLDGP